jgi:hypothetical protein
MVINRLGYKVSTIGLISKHGFMKLVLRANRFGRSCSSKENNGMLSWVSAATNERTEVVALLARAQGCLPSLKQWRDRQGENHELKRSPPNFSSDSIMKLVQKEPLIYRLGQMLD